MMKECSEELSSDVVLATIQSVDVQREANVCW